MCRCKTDNLLDRKQVATLAGWGIATFDRRRKQPGVIPAPVIQERYKVYWARTDIEAWLKIPPTAIIPHQTSSREPEYSI